MKKLIVILCFIGALVAAAPALSASATEYESEPPNVTITVVIPDPIGAPADSSAVETAPAEHSIVKIYPSDVTDIRDGSGWQIVKTYELSEYEKPEDIPCDPFERRGWRFTLTDIIRHEMANAETREHTETVALETETKELEQILTMFSPSMDYKSDDGFAGIIMLDISSIKVETAGISTSGYTMSVIREYPNLSANDTSFVPKTVTDRGTVYTLAGVEWKAGNYATVDYERIPEYYTAVATYTATGTSTRVTGYITTADYTGTLAKLSQGKTVYTAYFLGEEIRTPLEMVSPTPAPDATAEQMPEPTSEPAPETAETAGSAEAPDAPQKSNILNNGALFAIIPCLAVLGGGAYYFLKRKVKHDAKTHNTDLGAADDGGGGSGSGG
jgi:hypothetical protein